MTSSCADSVCLGASVPCAKNTASLSQRRAGDLAAWRHADSYRLETPGLWILLKRRHDRLTAAGICPYADSVPILSARGVRHDNPVAVNPRLICISNSAFETGRAY